MFLLYYPYLYLYPIVMALYPMFTVYEQDAKIFLYLKFLHCRWRQELAVYTESLVDCGWEV